MESALARIVGRPRVLSPREWALVAAWHERGVPLAAVIEVLEEIGARSGGGSTKLRTLAYAVPAVEEAWLAIRDGRAEPAAAGRRPETGPGRDAWRDGWERAPEGGELRALLEALFARLEAGESAAEVDAALDASLESAAAAETVAEAARESERALAPYRARIEPAEFARTLARARVDRLRERLGLPRLTVPR